MEDNNINVLVILGPTATGKTDLALNLAKKFNGELISCDSRQVYVGLDVGTGKLPSGRWRMEDGRWKKGKSFWRIDRIKIWMYDVISPKKQYSVADYVQDAKKVIGKIRKKGKLPIIVGGTGFYLRALLEGIPNLSIPVDKNLRQKLSNLTIKQLQRKLSALDKKRWNALNNSDSQNPRRLVRAIELVLNKANQGDQVQGLEKEFNFLKIGLTTTREILYKRVDKHVIERINQGMIEEAKTLYKSGLSTKRMRQLGLEYGVLANFLEGKIKDKDELIKILQGKIHGYVRRQLTWFKNPTTCSGPIFWFDISEKNFPNNVEKLIVKWYDSSDDPQN